MRLLALSASAFLLLASFTQAGELPKEAQKIIKGFERAEAKILKAAESEIAPIRRKAAANLKALQDLYCRQAKLDQALAIREAIRQLKRIRPDPGYLKLTREQIGKTLHFEVVGAATGNIWGSEVYTSDSHLGTVAVHAGILKAGQKGILTVRVLSGQKSYRGATRNGITSQSYGAWGVSFTVEKSHY